MAVDLTRDGRGVRGRAGSSAGGQATRKGAIRGRVVVVVEMCFMSTVHSRPHLHFELWTAQSRMDKGFTIIRPYVHKYRAQARTYVRAHVRVSHMMFLSLL